MNVTNVAKYYIPVDVCKSTVTSLVTYETGKEISKEMYGRTEYSSQLL